MDLSSTEAFMGVLILVIIGLLVYEFAKEF